MSDIQQQLGAILGREVKQVRKTGEIPPRVAVIDLISAVLDLNANNAAFTFARLRNEHPEVTTNGGDFKFRGQGQKNTPVTDVRGAVEIILLLPGRQAARVRRQAAELMVRYLGGDLSLVDEVCAIRGFQEELAATAPEDPRRVFGEAVEATGSSSGEQLARVCTDIVARALPAVLDKLTAHIDQRLAHLESRQRVNLNVRAPKGASPQNPPIAIDIAGARRPFPVAKFLDQKTHRASYLFYQGKPVE